MRMYYVSRTGAAIASAVLIAAAWFSIRLARADAEFRTREPASVARAIALAPGNTAYLMFGALQVEYDGGDPTPMLERAAALNPLASAPRIRLGLEAEIHGDFDGAEKWLLDAASIDRQFEPRWTLANFYFRRGNQTEFWKWMRRALEVSYGDRKAAFDLCWRVAPDAKEILARAVPDQHGPLAAYLAYLIDTHRGDQAAPVALKLAAFRDSFDRPALFQACDAMIEAHDAASAGELWRAMGYALPKGIFNGNFTQPWTGHGFDWRLAAPPGVVYTPVDQPQTALRIALNGQQPESCELARQIVRLQSGRRYTLRWEARMDGIESPSGIDWSIGGQRGEISTGDLKGELAFTASSDLEPLTLTYQRPLGEARAEGSIEIRNVSIGREPEARSQ